MTVIIRCQAERNNCPIINKNMFWKNHTILFMRTHKKNPRNHKLEYVYVINEVVLLIHFRSLNRERSGKILLNMCVSMLLMNATFILMAETTRSDGMVLCTISAILLHYFLLTSLMWMCTEAVNMYQALIKVFTTYSSYFILKRCIVAWGMHKC